jgi:hypothetical protein
LAIREEGDAYGRRGTRSILDGMFQSLLIEMLRLLEPSDRVVVQVKIELEI